MMLGRQVLTSTDHLFLKVMLMVVVEIYESYLVKVHFMKLPKMKYIGNFHLKVLNMVLSVLNFQLMHTIILTYGADL